MASDDVEGTLATVEEETSDAPVVASGEGAEAEVDGSGAGLELIDPLAEGRLAVSVDARRTGVGSALVAALIAHPRLTGLTVLAYVHQDSVASRELLVTCGFTLTSAPVQEWLAAIR